MMSDAGSRRSLMGREAMGSDRGLMVILRFAMVGFFLNCSPSEAYLTAYLKHNKHLTSRQLDNNVWPWDTYAAFAFLPLCGVLAEVIGYKATVIVGFVFAQSTRVLLIFATQLSMFSLMQVTYAASSATVSVYYAMVYVTVAKENYKRDTAIVHAAWYAGNLVGSLIGQIWMWRAPHTDILLLMYVSWGFTTVAALLAIWMPPPHSQLPPSLPRIIYNDGLRAACRAMMRLYGHPTLLIWGVWWIFSYGLHNLVDNYYQTLFSEVSSTTVNYGAVEVAIELASMAGALLPLAFSQWAVASPVVSTAVAAGTAILSCACYVGAITLERSIWNTFAFIVAALGLYAWAYSQACLSVGAHLEHSDGRYALFFTLNSFLSLGAAVGVQEGGAARNLRTASYFVIAAVGAAASAVFIVAALAVSRCLYPPLSTHQLSTDQGPSDETKPLLGSTN
eukprot:c5978_g1_i1.p1 GENE.c5978_g1_i1~~c5978_g1_i1.p1  ORF type:complete len:449 (+),score=56.61 c5978_g1_i1:276-1622(+)